MLKKLKPLVDIPRGSERYPGWIGFRFTAEPMTSPSGQACDDQSEVLLSMEDVIACLGFTTADNPLAKVQKHPGILEAVSHLAEKRDMDSITPQQKEAADKLMEIMRGEATGGGEDQMEASEAAAQLLAMVAADDTKNPHLLYVDRWITTCCTVLRSCRALPGEKAQPWSESLVVCAASCLADLANNPRSTILCSTRASEIFQSLQCPLLLDNVQNRMIYYQACRGLAEILHPSTWPMNECAKIPRRLIEQLLGLLRLNPELPLKAPQEAPAPALASSSSTAAAAAAAAADADADVGGAVGAGDGDVKDGEAGPSIEDEGVGKEGGQGEEGESAKGEEAQGVEVEVEEEEDGPEAEPLTQEDLIRSQACKVVQFMATSGAAQLLLENAPGIVEALEAIRSSSSVEEVVLEADSALMSLWLCPLGFNKSDAKLRPDVAEHLLRALGSEDLVDNHQDCSLALVTATMNPEKGIRDEALQIFGGTLEANPDLVRILIGHVEDSESLAHQSIVYFMLHLLEVDLPLAALASTPEQVGMLVGALVATACNERHYAPVSALIRLVYHPASRQHVRFLLTPPLIQKLRSIPGGRLQKEVDSLIKALVVTEKDPAVTVPPSEGIDLAAAYRDDPSLQSLFFRKLVVSKGEKGVLYKRTKSADDVDLGDGADGSQSSASHIV